MDIREDLLLWFMNFFDKKSKEGGVHVEVKHNEQLAKELHKPIIRNFLKRTVYSRTKDHVWGADLAVNKQI